jgi:hypothetical protein
VKIRNLVFGHEWEGDRPEVLEQYEKPLRMAIREPMAGFDSESTMLFFAYGQKNRAVSRK